MHANCVPLEHRLPEAPAQEGVHRKGSRAALVDLVRDVVRLTVSEQPKFGRERLCAGSRSGGYETTTGGKCARTALTFRSMMENHSRVSPPAS